MGGAFLVKCCDITTAQLNRKVELYNLVKSATSTGGFTESWVKVADVWCKIKNMSGSEVVHADQLGVQAYTDFTMRYRQNINEVMKLVYRGTDYQIRHINNIEESDLWLVVKGERGVSQ